MFHPFQVEQFLSENEQNVAFNFSESGVHPLTLGELLEISGGDLERLSSVLLDYPEVCGDRQLRESIAEMYPGADSENVLVIVGASEANQLVADVLLRPADEVVALRPTYQQLPGNALNLGVRLHTVDLLESLGWALDLQQLKERVVDTTRLIAVVNPNNPTGRILREAEMAAIIEAAERVGAWIVADEVYSGTEREGEEKTPSFWGRYDRVIAINGMSKAYGLPGLRLGWLVAPKDMVADLWRRHEYATISTAMLSNELAKLALKTDVRDRLTARARRLIRVGFDTLREGLAVHPGVFSVVPPEASAMSFVRYNLPIKSMDFAKKLIEEQSTLVLPGSCFGLEYHFRFSSALPEAYLREGLARFNLLVGQTIEK